MFLIDMNIIEYEKQVQVFYKISCWDEAFEKYLLQLARRKKTIHLENKKIVSFPVFLKKETHIVFSKKSLNKDQDCLEEYIKNGSFFVFPNMKAALLFANQARYTSIRYLRRKKRIYKMNCWMYILLHGFIREN